MPVRRAPDAVKLLYDFSKRRWQFNCNIPGEVAKPTDPGSQAVGRVAVREDPEGKRVAGFDAICHQGADDPGEHVAHPGRRHPGITADRKSVV